jgi:hypothetical protein
MLKYDEDRTIIFKRETTVVKNPYRSYDKYLYADLIIGFCGHIYFGLIYLDFYNNNEILDVIWSASRINEIFQERHNNLGDRYKKWNKLRIYEVVLHNLQQKYHEFAPKENVPIWARYCNTLILNPRLKDYSFQKVVPPAPAYQNLRVWVSNQAMPEKPLPKIDDLTLSEAKGFNRYSFRCDKQKK